MSIGESSADYLQVWDYKTALAERIRLVTYKRVILATSVDLMFP